MAPCIWTNSITQIHAIGTTITDPPRPLGSPSSPWTELYIKSVIPKSIEHQVFHSRQYCTSSLSFQTVLYIKSTFPNCIEYQVCHSELPRFLWILWITLDPTDPFGGLKGSGVSKGIRGSLEWHTWYSILFGMTNLIYNSFQNETFYSSGDPRGRGGSEGPRGIRGGLEGTRGNRENEGDPKGWGGVRNEILDIQYSLEWWTWCTIQFGMTDLICNTVRKETLYNLV